MSETTLRIMAGVERRLNTLLRLEASACGFEGEVAKCNRQRDKLMKYIDEEVERVFDVGFKAGAAAQSRVGGMA